jgi:ubiquinone/menaquinone biosynthesis C-methylase UbiE
MLDFDHDEEERRRWQNPETILADIGLKPSLTFIDIGCGDGFFAIPAAQIVGKKGMVYGVDIDDEAISTLRKRAAKKGFKNLHLTVAPAEETIFCEACADIVFFGIVLHDFNDASKVLLNARKMLKRTGRLVDLDWKRKPMEFGPPLRARFSEEKAANLIKAAGFKIRTVKDAGPLHYLITAEQSTRTEILQK